MKFILIIFPIFYCFIGYMYSLDRVGLEDDFPLGAIIGVDDHLGHDARAS